MRPWIRKRDSNREYYWIINDLRLTDEENFSKKISEKPLVDILVLLFCLNKNQNYVFPLFTILYKWTLFIKKFFTTRASFFFYVMLFRKQNNIFCTSEASSCFTQKINFCIHYTEFFFFFSKSVIFLYILKIFFYILKNMV